MFETKGSIKAPVKELKKALNQLKGIIRTPTIVPILENVRISDVKGQVSVLGSDLQTTASITVYHPSTTDNKVFILLDYSRLSKLISKITSEFVTFTPSEKEVLIECEEGQFWMQKEDESSFPKTPMPKYTQVGSIGSEILLEGLKIVLPSCSTDDLRPAMTGIKVEYIDDLLHLTSTDGHRLSSCSYKQQSAESIGPGFILQKRLGAFLSQTLKEGSLVGFHWDERNINLHYNNINVVSRIIDERYPDWRSALPKGPHLIERSFDSQEFQRRVALAGVFSNTTTNQIKLSFNGDRLSIASEDLDYSSRSSQSIELNIPFVGEYSIGFNSKFLSDILKPYKGQFLLSCWQPNQPALIYPAGRVPGKKMHAEDFFHLIMPVMLNTYI
jgi:DNA polymerase III subunit beta